MLMTHTPKANKLKCMVAIQSMAYMVKTTQIRALACYNKAKSFFELSQNMQEW